MATTTKAMEEEDSKDVKPGLGYCLTLEEANRRVRVHEDTYGIRYGLLRADPNFGSANWNKEDCRIQWEEIDKFQGERLEFDGVPFIVLGSKYLCCQHGVRVSAKSSRYAEWRKEEGEEALARKGSCPARIVMKEIVKFPDYKIESNTNYEKKKWSKVVRDDIREGTARPQRRIYVHLPSSQDHQHIHIVKTLSVVPHCLICNGKLSASVRSAIPLFSNETRTSHRQLEVVALLSTIVGQEVEEEVAHSRSVCIRCFNLIDEIDSLEEQLSNKKQIVVDRYKRTMVDVTRNGSSPDDLALDEDHVLEIAPFVRKRGRPRGRGRGPGRPRGSRSGRGRGYSRSAPDCSSLVKVELNDSPSPEEPTQEVVDEHKVLKAIKAPPVLKTIKKEDIMSDAEASQDDQHKIVGIESMEEGSSMSEEEEEVTATIIPIVEDSGTMEAQVLEVVEEVLEEEEKHEKLYTCSQCDKQFMTKAAIRNHIKTHDRFDANYDCEECEKSFSNKYSLKAHLKTHVDRDRPHICRVCNKSFYTRYHLNSHLKSHEGARNFVCELCGKALSTQKTLELHALTHTGEKPFQCEICGSTFRQRSNLLTHIKATHYQEKNYHCNLCQKSFVRKRLLVYHMNSVHTGQRPYKCNLCTASFVYPHYYKRHLRKHTGDKPHKCHVCGKSFSSRENRNAHMFIHSDKKPYECKLCGIGFMRKPMCISHLAAHGQTANPEEHIVFNSPSALVNAGESIMVTEEEEVEHSVHTVRVSAETGDVEEVEEQPTQITKDDKVVKVMSRPAVHFIDADDNTRYVIQTGERLREENMEQFFAEIAVEVRTEDF